MPPHFISKFANHKVVYKFGGEVEEITDPILTVVALVVLVFILHRMGDQPIKFNIRRRMKNLALDIFAWCAVVVCALVVVLSKSEAKS